MRWMKAQLFLVVAVVAMLFAVSLPAQAEAVHAGRRSQRFPVVSPPYTSPQFIGLVTDPDGHPVPGVQIVGNVDGVTGSDGRQSISQMSLRSTFRRTSCLRSRPAWPFSTPAVAWRFRLRSR
jgi:hypothetical protein